MKQNTEVLISAAYMILLLITFLVIVNWRAIVRVAKRAWNFLLAAWEWHAEHERSLTPEERAYLEETNLFV